MSKPVKPGWPDPAGLPFNLFGASPGAQPLAEGLAGGFDLFKQFWGKLPGGAALPGFLVPTMDVEELDKRIKDLRAAESWVEVNLTMLRGTIQGLEVQRNTIAAIQSFSAIADHAMTAQPAAAAPHSALPAGWPGTQFPKADPAPPPPPPAEQPAATVAPPDPVQEPPVAAEAAGGGMLAGMAANHWLGFMQDQFAKVAQAALATQAGHAGVADEPAVARPSARKKAGGPVAKKTARRAKAVRKTTGT
ncbi:MAG: PhaM family polyhydroxyalkanoate granule multifunctional regulatory protein [Burkholderiaceae bacterium]